MKIDNKNKSLLYSLLAVFFWSTIASAFKLTLNGMTSVQLLFYASFVSSVVLLVIVFKKFSAKEVLEKWKSNFWQLILLGLLNPFLFYLILFKAYEMLPAQDALVLNFTWPIVLSVFSLIFLHEKFSFKIFVGLIAAFTGVVVIVTKGSFFQLKIDSLVGALLALSSTLIWSAYWIVNLKSKIDSTIKLSFSFLFGALVSFIYLLVVDSIWIENGITVLGAVYIGLFEMGLTFLFWLKGLELSDNRMKTSTLAYFAPFFSLLFISIILDEKILLSSLVGLMLIICGILIQRINFKNSQ